MAFCTHCGAAVDGKFCTSCGAAIGNQPEAAPPPPPSTPPPGPSPLPPPAPPAAAYPPPQPSGKSPWMYVLFGCLGITILGIAGFMALGFFAVHKAKQAGFDAETISRNPALAAAKAVVAINPDVEWVSADEDKGIVTLRDKKTGKTATFNFEDIKKGKMVFTDEDGKTASVQVGPDGLTATSKDGTVHVGGTWNPPTWVPAYPGAKMQGVASEKKDDVESGAGAFTTTDSIDAVLQYYRKALEEKGMKITGGEGTALGKTLVGEDDNRKVTIMASGAGSSTQVAVSYSNERK